MTTSLCKRVFLLLAGAAFLLMGCAATADRRQAPVWPGPGQPGSREGFSRTGEPNKGPWDGLDVAVLPVHNMTAVPAPLKDIEKLFYDALGKSGVLVIEKDVLAEFMAKWRLRYTGGIDRMTASAMREEMGVEAVLITSLEHLDEGDPPKISLHARLVTTGKDLQIRWIDSYCKAGDDAPGFLNLGVIDDPRELMERAVDHLALSMTRHIDGGKEWRNGADPGQPDPLEGSYRSPDMEIPGTPTLAVMPFLNLSERSHAWEIMPLHFVEQMAVLPGVRILEPGEVRRALLSSRVFLQGGLSLPHLELVLRSTGADLVLSGTVLRYLDTRAASKDPEVEFSVQMLDRTNKEVVWSSRNDGRGSDGVFFFGMGRKSTACSLANALVGETVSGMSLQPGDPTTTSIKEGVVP